MSNIEIDLKLTVVSPNDKDYAKTKKILNLIYKDPKYGSKL